MSHHPLDYITTVLSVLFCFNDMIGFGKSLVNSTWAQVKNYNIGIARDLVSSEA